jgi:secreted PhoX family phosphatase
MTDAPLTRSEAFEASEDTGRNDSANPTIGDIIAARFDRRDVLRGALGTVAIAATVGPAALAPVPAHANTSRNLPKSPPASMQTITSPKVTMPTS